MRDLEITENEKEQRLDRYLQKYLDKASQSLIQKWIRTKKVKVNRSKADPQTVLKKGDVVNLFIYDEVLEPYRTKRSEKKSRLKLNILYEDENIAILVKDINQLVHPASPSDYGLTLVDAFIEYLIINEQFHPRMEKTFRPAIANRLDRNTRGLVIGCKNAATLRQVNERIFKHDIRKFYRTIVSGKITKPMELKSYLKKDDQKNMVRASSSAEDAKWSVTKVIPIRSSGDYTVLEIELITGRTHQIRSQLAHVGHPIIGDTKYGKAAINKKAPIEHQYLIANKLIFNGFAGALEYLNNQEFSIPYDHELEQRILGGKNDH